MSKPCGHPEASACGCELLGEDVVDPADLPKRKGSAGKGHNPNAVKRDQLERFAAALFDPNSLTFGNTFASYKSVMKLSEIDSAGERRCQLWAKHPVVAKIRRRILMRAPDGGPLSKESFIRVCLDREEKYANRGEKGDAQASVHLLETIAKVCDFFPRAGKKKEFVPIATLAPITGDELADKVMERLERISRLRQQNPMAKIAAGGVVVEQGEPMIGRPTMDEKNKAAAEARRRMCVNHPEKIAHYLTWKEERPLCNACLATPRV